MLTLRYARSGQPDSVSFNERYVALRSGQNLELSVLHRFEIIRDGGSANRWRVHSTAYYYQARQADGPELFAFHWHPRVGREHITFPHFHFSGTTAPIDLGKKHVPTGRVSVEAVIRFLITEMDVRPLRPDWDRVVTANEAAFNANRTW